MEQNMTALVSLFARAYHQKNKDIKIFDDLLSTKLITEKEYEMIGLNMSQGISFFNPTFKGSEEEALKWIVDHQLSPSVLVRSAFCKEAIEEMKEKGCQQYLDFASGYDSFAYYYQNQMHVFEIDKKEVIEDKRQRCKDVDIENIQFLSIDLSQDNWINTLLQSDYQEDQLSISSMLGLSYYLTKDEFKKMLKQLSKYLLKGSHLVFDYPSIQESKETKINEMLAKEADESMKAKYSFAELKEILNQCHLTIIQHENHQTVTEKYISNYNVYYKDDPIKAPEGVCYCVVEK
ncbi:class I SAM-dependent methyltransferase [Faecalibacillus intestinalis]|uniref:class I SAM-dependent methyltransferase n=1 Tax=Faecalibacillus intestinalis TaxID=1982626 RepID=UPI003FF11D80